MADQPAGLSLPGQEMRIGAVLRQGRESAALSISYVAAQIHLHENVIRALENDQFDQLPGGVFTRGYIRSYAKLLDIDAQQLIGVRTEFNAGKNILPAIKKPKKIKSFRFDPVIIWSAVSVIILLVGLLATWWVQQHKQDPVALESVVEKFDNALIKSVHEIRENPQPRQNRHYQAGISYIDPEHIFTQQNAAAPPRSGEIDKVRVTVKYTEESWTEIFDARKRRLLHGLIKPGATRVISGQAPFEVFFGNSPGVRVEINGRPFDHSVYMRRNNTARFLIDLNLIDNISS